jgi:signal transduction histidine kinase
MDRAVKDAMREIRTISRGLSLPDIRDRCLRDIVSGVIDAHAARTGTKVDFDAALPDPPPDVSPAVKLCLYRFVQEGLNNAWRYAGGKGQRVNLGIAQGTLSLTVRDDGPGFDAPPGDPRPGADGDFRGMGLAGLRDRVESLGGTFNAQTMPGGGAELRMELDLREA